MFGLKKKGGPPTQPYTHASDCKILAVDPGFEAEWQEVETGYWVVECVCGKEYFREPPADRRVRLDPLDPAVARHLPQCEHAGTTDPTLLRAVLKVRDREGYAWVECGVCDAGWQVPHYAAESVG